MRTVVLGGGESGTGACLLAKKLGHEVFLSDKGSLSDKYRKVLTDNQIEFEEGGHSLDKIYNAGLVIKSPGIPDDNPVVKELRRRGVEVISEIEFAGRHSSAKMCCITGSNGKTTTTLLIKHIPQVAADAHPLYVIELSSFQLDGMFDFRADVAVLTNITPDHLDRYDFKYENYINSKFRILQNMRSEDLFVYGYDSDAVRKKVQELDIVPAQALFTYLDKKDCAAYMDGNRLTARESGRVFSIDKNEISIKGRHNIYNAMCAVLACMRLGVDNEKIAEGLRSFPQVEHRLETVLVKDGVTYINDSKATNVDSAWYALDSMTAPVVWIAGGKDKGNDYSVLYELVRKKVKALVCMGLHNEKLIESFSPLCKVFDTDNLEDAVKAARNCAEPGDVVLLSPCCASFDLFRSYEHRGEMFKQEVRK